MIHLKPVSPPCLSHQFIYCACRGTEWVLAHPSLFRLADASALKHLQRCPCWIQSPAPSSPLSLNVWLEHILPDLPFYLVISPVLWSLPYSLQSYFCPTHLPGGWNAKSVFVNKKHVFLVMWLTAELCEKKTSHWATFECSNSYLHAWSVWIQIIYIPESTAHRILNEDWAELLVFCGCSSVNNQNLLSDVMRFWFSFSSRCKCFPGLSLHLPVFLSKVFCTDLLEGGQATTHVFLKLNKFSWETLPSHKKWLMVVVPCAVGEHNPVSMAYKLKVVPVFKLKWDLCVPPTVNAEFPPCFLSA